MEEPHKESLELNDIPTLKEINMDNTKQNKVFEICD